MPRFSVLIRWEDGDEEQGEFGWTGLAADESEAEAKARAEMRTSYIEQYGEEGEDEDELCEHRTDAEGKFGGSVIEITRGAVWQAQELEDALRAILPFAESRAEDMLELAEECEASALDHPTSQGIASNAAEARENADKAVAAVDAAKALLASLDAED